jgi:hypothetical protein
MNRIAISFGLKCLQLVEPAAAVSTRPEKNSLPV